MRNNLAQNESMYTHWSWTWKVQSENKKNVNKSVYNVL